MGNLYQLTSDWIAVSDMLSNPETDPQAVADTLESIGYDIADKADGYAKVIANFNSDIEGLEAEIKRMQKLKAHLETTVKNMKLRLMDSMRITVGAKFRTNLFAFPIVNNPPSVEVNDSDAIPAEYTRTTTVTEPDKAKIKEAIAAGKSVAGARLVQSERLSIK